MARPTIKDIQGAGEFQQLTRWNIDFSGIPAPARAGIDVSKLNFLCETIEQPNLTIQSGEVMLRGQKVKQGTIADYGNTMTITFVEVVDATVEKMLLNWKSLLWQPLTGIQAPPSIYKGFLNMQKLDGRNLGTWQYIVDGVYYEGQDRGGSLDGSSTDFARPSVTLSFDYFIELPLKV